MRFSRFFYALINFFVPFLGVIFLCFSVWVSAHFLDFSALIYIFSVLKHVLRFVFCFWSHIRKECGKLRRSGYIPLESKTLALFFHYFFTIIECFLKETDIFWEPVKFSITPYIQVTFWTQRIFQEIAFNQQNFMFIFHNSSFAGILKISFTNFSSL